MTKHMTINGLMTDEDLATLGMEFKWVKSTCSQCHQRYDVELLFSRDEPVLAPDEEWRGICEPCSDDLFD